MFYSIRAHERSVELSSKFNKDGFHSKGCVPFFLGYLVPSGNSSCYFECVAV